MVFSSSPYHEASKILSDILVNRKGLKSLVYSGDSKKEKKNLDKDSVSSSAGSLGTLKCSKSSYALTCQTLQYKATIDEILQKNEGELYDKIQMKNCHNIGLAYILLYELLFGKYQTIRGGGSLKRSIMLHEEALRTAATAVETSTSLLSPRRNTSPQFPKYVRVNSIKFHDLDNTQSAAEVVAQDLSQYIRQKTSTVAPDTNITSSRIYADAHVPDLLVLSPHLDPTMLYTHPYVAEGKIIFQDKSSCFPAMCLIHGLLEELLKNSSSITTSVTAIDIIDACAAPGNKTTHLAALLLLQQRKLPQTHDVTSQIFALDRDSKRIGILKKRCELLASYPMLTTNTKTTATKRKGERTEQKNIETEENVTVLPTHMDFLQTNHSDPTFANVRAILLDPSCSGSGIVNQPDRLQVNTSDIPMTIDNQNTKQRLLSLQNFQIVALKHAMSFPQVDRIVYSTCSIHEEENEIVVGKALREASTNDNNRSGWKICHPSCLDTWNRRGIAIPNLISAEEAQCMIRCDGLDGDETNGFFVCLLERQCPSRTATTKSGIVSEHKASKDKASSCLPVYNGQFRTTQPNDKGSKGTSKPKNINIATATTKESTKASNTIRNCISSKKRKDRSSTQVNQESISTPKEKKNSEKRRNMGHKVLQDVVDQRLTKVDVPITKDSFSNIAQLTNSAVSNSKSKPSTGTGSASTTTNANDMHEAKKEKKRKWKLRQQQLKQDRLLGKKNEKGTTPSQKP